MSKFLNMNKEMQILLCMTIVLLFFAISACEFVSIFTNSFKPTPPPPDWLTDWLQDPVCQPPCWYGITPGITTITDTAKILGELPWVKIEFGPGKPLDMGPDLRVEWSSKQQNDVGGFAFSDLEGKMTASLGFRGTLSTQLEDIFETFGYPTDVFASDCHAGICHTELIYMSSGMVLYIYPPPDWRGFIKVSPDAKVEEIWFFPPGLEGYLAAFHRSDNLQEWIVAWEGYTKYKVAIW